MDRIVRSRAGAKAKYIPGFVVGWLKRLIHQDFIKLGEAAFRQLKDLICGKAAQRIVLPCTLIKRGSVRDLKQPQKD